jgi:hypothetical protein
MGSAPDEIRAADPPGRLEDGDLATLAERKISEMDWYVEWNNTAAG